ncbi:MULTISPECIES: hypothetical protein [Peptostreptococcaceae]|uniref:Uncharacterized protein n=1 Tax=Terrisporobacter muris TaxID=2963284 RepID=A0A9X2S0B2_9FIRM|nr:MULTISPECIES: hypothetical protein [Peptostreptococcaceae]MCR1821640.1 hypothetical protein [Terrisporobacter muris]
MTAIITALVVISMFITFEIKRKAREKMLEWFSYLTEEDFK